MSGRFSIMTTNEIVALDGKPTKGCFTGRSYSHRRGGFDLLLPINQPSSTSCVSTILQFAGLWNPFCAAKKILSISVKTNAKLLGRALVESGHTMTLVQIEELVAKTECHEKTGLSVGTNYFFVETGNQEDPVLVGCISRYGTHWDTCAYSLDYCRDRHVFDQLLVRNLDISKV